MKTLRFIIFAGAMAAGACTHGNNTSAAQPQPSAVVGTPNPSSTSATTTSQSLEGTATSEPGMGTTGSANDPNGASDGLSIERSVTGDFAGNTARNLLGDSSGNQVAGTVTIASYKWQQSSNTGTGGGPRRTHRTGPAPPRPGTGGTPATSGSKTRAMMGAIAVWLSVGGDILLPVHPFP